MLSAETLEAIWRSLVWDQLFAGVRPAKAPVLILVGAQPGAGKTRAAAVAKGLHASATVVDVIGDDLRAFHPEYDQLVDDPDPEVMPARTAAEAGWWVERSLRFAAANGISVLVEGTFRNPDTPLATARQFDGFTRHAVALGVPRAVSWQGCVARYLAARLTGRPARWTPLEHHNLAYDQMITTLSQIESSGLFDRLTVIDRAGQIHHDGPGWVAAVEHLRQCPAADLVDEFHRTQEWLAEVSREGLPAPVAAGLDALADLATALDA